MIKDDRKNIWRTKFCQGNSLYSPSHPGDITIESKMHMRVGYLSFGLIFLN